MHIAYATMSSEGGGVVVNLVNTMCCALADTGHTDVLVWCFRGYQSSVDPRTVQTLACQLLEKTLPFKTTSWRIAQMMKNIILTQTTTTTTIAVLQITTIIQNMRTKI